MIMHNMGVKWLSLNSMQKKLSVLGEFYLISKMYRI